MMRPFLQVALPDGKRLVFCEGGLHEDFQRQLIRKAVERFYGEPTPWR